MSKPARREAACWGLSLALSVLVATGLGGCDKKGGGGGTQPRLPTNPTPGQLTRTYVPVFSSWSYRVSVTNATSYGTPSTKYAIWYYRTNNTYQQGGATFHSIRVSASNGSDLPDHPETWKLDDTGLTLDFGGKSETLLAPFPMTVGTAWTANHAYEFGHDFTTRLTCSGIDNIDTARGYLYAFRVSFHNERAGLSYGRPFTDTSDGTFWIAPDYGLVKASSTEFWGESGMTRLTQLDIT